MTIKKYIVDMLKQKIEEMGGAETLKKAIVWEWWTKTDVHNERDFDAAIDECYRCYTKVGELKKILDGGKTSENTTHFTS